MAERLDLFDLVTTFKAEGIAQFDRQLDDAVKRFEELQAAFNSLSDFEKGGNFGQQLADGTKAALEQAEALAEAVGRSKEEAKEHVHYYLSLREELEQASAAQAKLTEEARKYRQELQQAKQQAQQDTQVTESVQQQIEQTRQALSGQGFGNLLKRGGFDIIPEDAEYKWANYVATAERGLSSIQQYFQSLDLEIGKNGEIINVDAALDTLEEKFSAAEDLASGLGATFGGPFGAALAKSSVSFFTKIFYGRMVEETERLNAEFLQGQAEFEQRQSQIGEVVGYRGITQAQAQSAFDRSQDFAVDVDAQQFIKAEATLRDLGLAAAEVDGVLQRMVATSVETDTSLEKVVTAFETFQQGDQEKAIDQFGDGFRQALARKLQLTDEQLTEYAEAGGISSTLFLETIGDLGARVNQQISDAFQPRTDLEAEVRQQADRAWRALLRQGGGTDATTAASYFEEQERARRAEEIAERQRKELAERLKEEEQAQRRLAASKERERQQTERFVDQLRASINPVEAFTQGLEEAQLQLIKGNITQEEYDAFLQKQVAGLSDQDLGVSGRGQRVLSEGTELNAAAQFQAFAASQSLEQRAVKQRDQFIQAANTQLAELKTLPQKLGIQLAQTINQLIPDTVDLVLEDV